MAYLSNGHGLDTLLRQLRDIDEPRTKRGVIEG